MTAARQGKAQKATPARRLVAHLRRFNRREFVSLLAVHALTYDASVSMSPAAWWNIDLSDAVYDSLSRLRGFLRNGIDQRVSEWNATQTDLAETAGVTLSPDQALALREKVRAESGLPLFPGLASSSPPLSSARTPTSEDRAKEHRLLDVEVTAIYW